MINQPHKYICRYPKIVITEYKIQMTNQRLFQEYMHFISQYKVKNLAIISKYYSTTL